MARLLGGFGRFSGLFGFVGVIERRIVRIAAG
jgi:hypothetical protein